MTRGKVNYNRPSYPEIKIERIQIRSVTFQINFLKDFIAVADFWKSIFQ